VKVSTKPGQAQLDAKVEKVRDGGRVVRKALVLAYGVHESGYREVIGLDVGEAETEAFWRSFLRGLVERGLTGVQLVVSDAHAGLKNAIAQVLGCPWQRCTVHILREALGHARREQQPMLAALFRPIFNAENGEHAQAQVTAALERLHEPLPKIHDLLEEAEDDLLAFYTFPPDHWPKLRSTNPLERVNREIGRRTDVVGIFPNDRSLIRLAASVVIEQNDCHEGGLPVVTSGLPRTISASTAAIRRRPTCSISVSTGEPARRRGARPTLTGRCSRVQSRPIRTGSPSSCFGWATTFAAASR
jgi:transposase-like protein